MLEACIEYITGYPKPRVTLEGIHLLLWVFQIDCVKLDSGSQEFGLSGKREDAHRLREP